MDTLALLYAGCALIGMALAFWRPPTMPRHWLLVAIAAAPQIGILLGLQLPGMFLITACALCAWGLYNRTIPGVAIIAFGMLLNMLVMACYGGAMPIRTDTLAQIGQSAAPGALLAGSKDIATQTPVLGILSDWIIISLSGRTIVASPGDLIAVAGLIIWLLASHLPKERVYDDGPARHSTLA